MSKKTLILQELFENHHVSSMDMYTCTNEDIKVLARKHQFKNPFDVTKVDCEHVLPENMRSSGFKGVFYDKTGPIFVKRDCFCLFEEVTESKTINVPRNPFTATKACSENLSIMYLQTLIQDFLDIDCILNIGIFGRSRNVNIKLDMKEDELLSFNCNQIEIDMSYYYTYNDEEYIVYCELKRGKRKTFNVNQLYHCYMYHEYVSRCNNRKYKPVYLMINSDETSVSVYQFDFTEQYQPWSVQCIKSKRYILDCEEK